jgi:hypothetical protein
LWQKTTCSWPVVSRVSKIIVGLRAGADDRALRVPADWVG